MSNIDIIRAWKDEEYRNSLSEEQRSQLPENPSGQTQLSDEEMEAVAGGSVAQFKLPREFFVSPSTYFLTGCDVFPNG
jgi:mersacidin/lichenicidin family type 2 lantibiotic